MANHLAAIASIEDAALKRDNPQQYAQNTLIKTAVRLAVAALYADCAAQHWEVNTSLDDGRNLGSSQEEVLAAIYSEPNEFKQARTFNLLAKKNGFDLSLKTSGIKSPESTSRKQKMHPTNQITDTARISVVSSNVARLDSFAETINNSLALLQNGPDREWPSPTIEPWSMRANAMLTKILKTSINGVGTEVQFLPREQTRMAARITHHFYKVLRIYEDATASLDALDNPGKQIAELGRSGDTEKFNRAVDLVRKMNLAHEAITAYNQIAQFINKLGSEETMSVADMDTANRMLKSMDESNQTFDESGRDGSQETSYSPIFKTLNDLKTYRAYTKVHGHTIGLFPMPEISEHSSRKEAEAAMMKLFRCNQLTHACYMGDASESMRNLWVKHALETNENLTGDKKIPEGAIAAIHHTLDLAQLKGSHVGKI